MSARFETLARWLREPLVHFLLLGALLFVVFNWRGGGGPSSNRIVITPGQIDSMVAGFSRTWQRPPTEQELKGLIDDYVREEMATREAMAMGLDRDDTIIRRRLRQKLEFVAEDSIDATPPTEAQLQAWFQRRSEIFKVEPEVAFRQVYLNPDKRGAALEADGRRLVAQLSAVGGDADLTAIGDSLMVPNEVGRSTRTDVARQFGEEFADGVLKVEPGRWVGLLPSGYGVHIVWVRERQEGRTASLVEVRALVEREFLAERRTRELNATYERFLGRYRVTMEKGREALPGTGAAAAPTPGGSE